MYVFICRSTVRLSEFCEWGYLRPQAAENQGD